MGGDERAFKFWQRPPPMIYPRKGPRVCDVRSADQSETYEARVESSTDATVFQNHRSLSMRARSHRRQEGGMIL